MKQKQYKNERIIDNLEKDVDFLLENDDPINDNRIF